MSTVCIQTHTAHSLGDKAEKERKEKASVDSVCPREHFKDKPVDVSCSRTEEIRSGAGDARK